MIKKYEKMCKFLNYFEYFLALVSTISGYVSIFAFGSLFGVAVGIMSSTVALKIFPKTAGLKNYKSLIKKKRKVMVKQCFSKTQVKYYRGFCF